MAFTKTACQELDKIAALGGVDQALWNSLKRLAPRAGRSTKSIFRYLGGKALNQVGRGAGATVNAAKRVGNSVFDNPLRTLPLVGLAGVTALKGPSMLRRNLMHADFQTNDTEYPTGIRNNINMVSGANPRDVRPNLYF